MADSVVKLRIDSKEYDANIKRAGEALTQYFNRVRQGGGTLEHLDEGVMDAVKAMGELATKSDSTRGAMRELLQATADMTVQYRSLTDAERAAPIGEAMAQSIAQMTERAGVMRDAMDDVTASIQHAASDTRVFDQVAGGISLMTSGFQTAVGAANLFGIEIGNQEKVLTTLASAMSITNGLQTAQNLLQSQSALMQGVMAAKSGLAAAAQKAVALATGDATKAQAAYNAVANANPYVLLTTTIMGLVGAMTLFSSSADENAEKANNATTAIENMTTAAQSYIDIMRQLGASQDTLLTMGVDSAKSIYDAAVAQRQSIEKQIRDAMDSMDLTSVGALGKQLENARQAEKNAQANYGKALDARRSQAMFNQELMKRWDSLNTDQEIDAAIQAFTKLRRETERGSAAWKMYDDRITKLQDKLHKAAKTTTKGGRGGGRGGGSVISTDPAPAYSIAGLTAQMQALRKEQELVTSTSAWVEYQRRIFGVTDAMKVLRGELSPQGLGAVSFSDEVRKAVEADQQSFKNKKLDVKIVQPKVEKADMKTSEVLSSISSAVGNMVSGIEGLGIEIPKGMQNMLGTLNSITMILTSIEAFQKVGTFLGIFSHGGVVKAASGYTVPGRRFSGDMIPARLNAGELVLNQAQAGVIASALQDRDFSGGVSLQPYVEGERIYLGVENTLKRKGKGEIVTTSMLRRMGLMN